MSRLDEIRARSETRGTCQADPKATCDALEQAHDDCMWLLGELGRLWAEVCRLRQERRSNDKDI